MIRLEYWTVQNSGWSAGETWFDVMAARREPLRFESEERARAYALGRKGADDTMRWRTVHIEVRQVSVCKTVTTTEWTEV